MTAEPPADAPSPSPPTATAGGAALPPAGLRVRLAAMVYEAMLMFGVLFLSVYLYSALTQQRHALEGRAGLQAFVLAVCGIYFTWFWSHGRQTLAQKTWRIQLVTRTGDPVTQWRALARFLASWLWFAPGLLVLAVSGQHGAGAITSILFSGWALYALLALSDADRQFMHDRLCGTRLVRRA